MVLFSFSLPIDGSFIDIAGILRIEEHKDLWVFTITVVYQRGESLRDVD